MTYKTARRPYTRI